MIRGVDIKLWLDMAQFGLTILVGGYVWFTGRSKATTKSIHDLSTLVTRELKEHERQFAQEQKDNEKRLIRLEEARTSALRQDDLKELYLRLSGIERGLSKLEGRFESVDHLNQSIQDIGLRSK